MHSNYMLMIALWLNWFVVHGIHILYLPPKSATYPREDIHELTKCN
jgi:hypothetical protein